MAAGFWHLEDGRCFSRNVYRMWQLLELINKDIKCIAGTELFADYIDYFIPHENDESNGYGGFIRNNTEEHIMLNLDLREFTEKNRKYFWEGAQKALNTLIVSGNPLNDGNIFLLKILLDMHKRIKQGESPDLLNHLTVTIPYSGKKKGPGWE